MRVERIDMTSGSAEATFKADAEPTALVLDPNVRRLAAIELVRRERLTAERVRRRRADRARPRRDG